MDIDVDMEIDSDHEDHGMDHDFPDHFDNVHRESEPISSDGDTDPEIVSNSITNEEDTEGQPDQNPHPEVSDESSVTIDSLSNSTINRGLDDLIPTVRRRASELDDTRVTLDSLSNSAINRGLDDLIPTVPRRASELNDTLVTIDSLGNSTINRGLDDLIPTVRRRASELDDTRVTLDSLSNSAINRGLDDLIPTVPRRASELNDTLVTIDSLSNSAVNRGLDDLIPTVPLRVSELDDTHVTNNTVGNSAVNRGLDDLIPTVPLRVSEVGDTHVTINTVSNSAINRDLDYLIPTVPGRALDNSGAPINTLSKDNSDSTLQSSTPFPESTTLTPNLRLLPIENEDSVAPRTRPSLKTFRKTSTTKSKLVEGYDTPESSASETPRESTRRNQEKVKRKRSGFSSQSSQASTTSTRNSALPNWATQLRLSKTAAHRSQLNSIEDAVEEPTVKRMREEEASMNNNISCESKINKNSSREPAKYSAPMSQEPQPEGPTNHICTSKDKSYFPASTPFRRTTAMPDFELSPIFNEESMASRTEHFKRTIRKDPISRRSNKFAETECSSSDSRSSKLDLSRKRKAVTTGPLNQNDEDDEIEKNLGRSTRRGPSPVSDSKQLAQTNVSRNRGNDANTRQETTAQSTSSSHRSQESDLEFPTSPIIPTRSKKNSGRGKPKYTAPENQAVISEMEGNTSRASSFNVNLSRKSKTVTPGPLNQNQNEVGENLGSRTRSSSTPVCNAFISKQAAKTYVSRNGANSASMHQEDPTQSTSSSDHDQEEESDLENPPSPIIITQSKKNSGRGKPKYTAPENQAVISEMEGNTSRASSFNVNLSRKSKTVTPGPLNQNQNEVGENLGSRTRSSSTPVCNAFISKQAAKTNVSRNGANSASTHQEVPTQSTSSSDHDQEEESDLENPPSPIIITQSKKNSGRGKPRYTAPENQAVISEMEGNTSRASSFNVNLSRKSKTVTPGPLNQNQNEVGENLGSRTRSSSTPVCNAFISKQAAKTNVSRNGANSASTHQEIPTQSTSSSDHDQEEESDLENPPSPIIITQSKKNSGRGKPRYTAPENQAVISEMEGNTSGASSFNVNLPRKSKTVTPGPLNQNQNEVGENLGSRTRSSSTPVRKAFISKQGAKTNGSRNGANSASTHQEVPNQSTSSSDHDQEEESDLENPPSPIIITRSKKNSGRGKPRYTAPENQAVISEMEGNTSGATSFNVNLSRKSKTVTPGPRYQNQNEVEENLRSRTRSGSTPVWNAFISKQAAKTNVSRNGTNSASTHQEVPTQSTSSSHHDQEEESDLENPPSPIIISQSKKNSGRGKPRYAAPENQAVISEMKSKVEKLLNHKNMLSRSTVREYLDVIGMKPATSKGIKRVYEGINQYMEIFFNRLCKKASRPNSMYTYKEFEAALKTEGLIGDERLELFCEICLCMNKDQLEKIRGILIPKKGEEDTLDW